MLYQLLRMIVTSHTWLSVNSFVACRPLPIYFRVSLYILYGVSSTRLDTSLSPGLHIIAKVSCSFLYQGSLQIPSQECFLHFYFQVLKLEYSEPSTDKAITRPSMNWKVDWFWLAPVCLFTLGGMLWLFIWFCSLEARYTPAESKARSGQIHKKPTQVTNSWQNTVPYQLAVASIHRVNRLLTSPLSVSSSTRVMKCWVHL